MRKSAHYVDAKSKEYSKFRNHVLQSRADREKRAVYFETQKSVHLQSFLGANSFDFTTED